MIITFATGIVTYHSTEIVRVSTATNVENLSNDTSQKFKMAINSVTETAISNFTEVSKNTHVISVVMYLKECPLE